MICYVAGPVSGRENGNRAAFQAASDQLRDEGWRVINPTDNPRSAEAEQEARELGPERYHEGVAYRSIMQDCLRSVVGVDSMFVLPGWQFSRGARLEVALAATMSIPIYEWETQRKLAVEPQWDIRTVKYADE